MQVRVDSIGPQGRHLDTVLALGQVAEAFGAAECGYQVKDEVRFKADLALTGRTVRFKGLLKTNLEGSCTRCLGAVELPLERSFELSLRPSEGKGSPGMPGQDREELGEGDADGSFRLDEADEDVYHGDELDLWPLLREQLFLSLPDYLICEEDCLGLCQVCGKNLNEKACGCDRDVPDPRLAGLKDIKLS